MVEEKFTGQYNLRPLWRSLINIYKEYASACNILGLKFCVDGGTMLGAIRHNGFIPWDDDFDVRMPGPDVDRFINEAGPYLPPYLKIVSWQNSRGYPFLFPKIIESRKDVVARVAKDTGLRLPQGIYIDIFPYDGYPSSLAGRLWYMVRGYAMRLMANSILGRDAGTIKSKIGRMIGYGLRPFFWGVRTYTDYLAYCERVSRSYSYGCSDKCGWFNESKGHLQRLDVVHSWDDLTMVPFEDIEVPVPSNYDAILEASYPNWRVLPPAEKRILFHNWGNDVSWKYGPISR